jgi:hypothetical protein
MTGDERWLGVYGSPDGRWLLITGPVGLIGPAEVAAQVPRQPLAGPLVWLGSPSDLITLIYAHLAEKLPRGYRGRRGPAQRTLADYLSVKQQDISHYVGGGNPRFTDDQWRRLVVAHFDPDVLLPAGRPS